MKDLNVLSITLILFLLVSSFNHAKAVSTLSIDCNNKLRGATHCASGSLYGLIENIPADYDSLVPHFIPLFSVIQLEEQMEISMHLVMLLKLLNV